MAKRQAKDGFHRVLATNLFRDLILPHLDGSATKAFAQVSRACFAQAVNTLYFDYSSRWHEDVARELLSLVGPALVYISYADPPLTEDEDLQLYGLLHQCSAPVEVSFDRLSFRYKEDMRRLRDLLNEPMVKSLEVVHFPVRFPDAVAIFAHPKFRFVDPDPDVEVELGDVQLPAACLPKLDNVSVILCPLSAHHLEAPVLAALGTCSNISLYPQDATRAVRDQFVSLDPAVVQKVFGRWQSRFLFEYESANDFDILTTLLRHTDVNRERVCICSTHEVALSEVAVDTFLDALGKMKASDEVHLSVGAEIASERLMVQLANALRRHPDDDMLDSLTLTCVTPEACEDACALLRHRECSCTHLTIRTLPSVGKTNAWMWKAMASTPVASYAYTTASITLCGGCVDRGPTAREARRAGKAMGRSNVTHLTVMMCGTRTSWMAPFLRGFASTMNDDHECSTASVTLVVGTSCPDVTGRPVRHSDVLEALRFAESKAGSLDIEVDWNCYTCKK